MNIKINNFEKWLILKLKNDWIVPGLSLAIFDKDKIIYEYIYGVQNIKTKEKIKDNDRFCIASCSKSILCIAILKLIERNDIPNIFELTLGKIFNDIHEDYKNVKVKQLANHRSGIGRNYFDVLTEKKLYHEVMDGLKDLNNPTEARKELAIKILAMKPDYTPGTKFSYSGLGYCILTYILELYAKESYEDIIKQEIFDEFGMKNATWNINLDDNYVTGHDYSNYFNYGHVDEKNVLTAVNRFDYENPKYLQPGGAIWCTINDSVKYLQEYLKVFANESNFLSESTINKLLDNTNKDYNYGWFYDDNKLEHSGGFFNIGTQFYINYKNNLGLVVCINSTGPFGSFIKEEFIKLFIYDKKMGRNPYYDKYVKYKTKYLKLNYHTTNNKINNLI